MDAIQVLVQSTLKMSLVLAKLPNEAISFAAAASVLLDHGHGHRRASGRDRSSGLLEGMDAIQVLVQSAHGGRKVVMGTPSTARMNSGVTRLML